MITVKPIVEMMREVVKATEKEILPYLRKTDANIKMLHFLHGHPTEIINILTSLNRPQADQFKKYPLIALFQDFKEDQSKGAAYMNRATVKVVIVNQSDPNLKAADRYEGNFKKILYPIYEAYMGKLAASRYFQKTSSIISHTKTDRPFWGKEGLYGNLANTATDVLDCIELSNLELVVRNQYCVSKTKTFKNF